MVREETGIEARVLGVVAVRSRWGEAGGAVLVIFRCELVAGEPQADDYEISTRQSSSMRSRLRLYRPCFHSRARLACACCVIIP